MLLRISNAKIDKYESDEAAPHFPPQNVLGAILARSPLGPVERAHLVRQIFRFISGPLGRLDLRGFALGSD